MVDEHAITYQEKLSVRDLDYLVKKANKLGQKGRFVKRVHQDEDDEGIHIYFETEGNQIAAN